MVSFTGGLCNMVCDAMGRNRKFSFVIYPKRFLTDQNRHITQN